jgi:hypothetical protein
VIPQGQPALFDSDNLQLIRRRLGLHGAHRVIERLMLATQGRDLGAIGHRSTVCFYH